MRKFIFLLLLTVFLTGSSKEIYALGKVATVDTRILLILHPEMIDFDYSFGRFRRESSLQKDTGALYAELKAAQDKSDKEREIVKKENKDLTQQRFDINQAIYRETNILAPGDVERLTAQKKSLLELLMQVKKYSKQGSVQKSINEAKAKNLQERIDEITALLDRNIKRDEKQVKKRVEQLKDKLKAVDEKIALNQLRAVQIEESAIASVYLTSRETSEKIKPIKEEILAFIKELAEESGFDIIIDSSFASDQMNMKRSKNGPSVIENIPDAVSTSLFQNFINLTITEDLIKRTNMPREYAQKHIVAGHTLGMQSNLKQYLGFRNYLPENLSDFSCGKLFLIGGNDITVSVATKIMNKYNIPDVSKKQLLRTLKEYLNFEDEPFIRDCEY